MFSIPKGYEDFVTPASELLAQMRLSDPKKSQNGDSKVGASFDSNDNNLNSETNQGTISDECLQIRIYCDSIQSCSINERVSQYKQLRQDILCFLEPLTKSYLWHTGEPFDLSICLPAEPKGCIHIYSLMRYSDNIEDEWFIISLLIRLSITRQDLSIQVKDSDGEFLLIEAAEYLQKWIRPDNSHNRVWLKRGRLCIIPEKGLVVDDLSAVLKFLANPANKNKIEANEKAQDMIKQRTINVYPAKAHALEHNTVCLVPNWMARCLQANSGKLNNGDTDDHLLQIIASSIETYCCAERESSITSLSSLVNSIQIPGSSFGPNERLVAMQIRCTRAQFAQMTFRRDKFKVPRKYQGMLRRVMKFSSSVAVQKAFYLGCRLLCGLELAYAESRDNESELNDLQSYIRTAVENEVSKQCISETLIGDDPIRSRMFIQDEDVEAVSTSTIFHCSLHRLVDNAIKHRHADKTAAGAEAEAEAEAEEEGNSDNNNSNSNSSNSEEDRRHNFDMDASDRAAFESISKGEIKGDSEAWLYLEPDELERELTERVRAYNPSAETAAPVEPVEPSQQATESNEKTSRQEQRMNAEAATDSKADQLQELADKFKQFLSAKSDFEGVDLTANPEISRSKSRVQCGKKTAKNNQSSLDSSHAGTSFDPLAPAAPLCGLGAIDSVYLDRILENTSEPSEDPRERVGVAMLGVAQVILPSGDGAIEAKKKQGEGEGEEQGAAVVEDVDSDDSDDDDGDDDDDDDGAEEDMSEDEADDESYESASSDDDADRARSAGDREATKRSPRGFYGLSGESLGKYFPTADSEYTERADSDDASADGDALSSDADSDGGEEDGIDGDGDGESFSIEDIQRAMDEELFDEEALMNTFSHLLHGKSGELEESDLDANFLKNLLDCHSEAAGMFQGPLQQLFSHMGMSMPKTPPIYKNT